MKDKTSQLGDSKFSAYAFLKGFILTRYSFTKLIIKEFIYIYIDIIVYVKEATNVNYSLQGLYCNQVQLDKVHIGVYI